MAVASYTNDLTDWIIDSDTTAWGELAGAIAGGAPDEADTESSLQGTNTVSQANNTTNLFSMCRILGTPITLSAGQVFLVWHGHGVATALLDYASGGLRLAVATDLNNWKAWAIGGIDVPPFPYGKWVNNPIDPTVTAEYSNGTPPTGATNIYGVGSMGQLSQAVAKGQPHVVDIIRYGRAEARMNGGELATGYATFAGFAAVNDATTARWGLIQKTDGGYLWKGLMTLGYTSAVDFRDTNKTIFIQDTRKVLSSFNRIEIRQATSRVEWTGINFTCLSPSTTASKGELAVIDNATVVMDACNFTDMNTFVFLGNSDVTNSQFLRCGQVTSGGGLFTNTNILSSTVVADEGALFYDINADPDGELDGMTFSKGTNAHHAIRFGTNVPATMTLRNCTFNGFSSSDDVDGSVFRFDDTSGAITLNLVNCSTNGTFSVDDLAGVTVTINIDPVTTLVNIKDENGDDEAGVSVYLEAASFVAGGLPYQQSITSITRSVTTATVTFATPHGLKTNEYLKLYGITDKTEDLSGAHQVTVTNSTVLTYQTTDSGSTNYSGTITGTGATIYGVTDANGNISSSRTYTSAQPLRGYARKATTAPYYKPIELNDTVNSTAGLTINRRLALDQ